MTKEEKLQLNRDRQYAVREAWKRERDLVLCGMGTRDWSIEEQKELLETGCVKGYEGQHMISCSLDPSQAANPDNVQFLTHENHLDAHNQAGGQGYLSPTYGYYDEKTKKLRNFEEGETPHLDHIKLSNAYCESLDYRQARENELTREEEKRHFQTCVQNQSMVR